MTTNTDRLFDALKIMGITTAPTDTAGRLAWYAANGQYLGTFTEQQGLAHLAKFVGQVAAERA